MSPVVRSFISIEISESVVCSLQKTIQQLERGSGLSQLKSVRWVKPDNIHLTLLFLGNQPVDQLAQLGSILANALKETKPFDIELNRLGGFPGKKSHIIAANILPSEKLKQLHQCVASKAADLQIDYDNKPFKPHITMARLKTKQLIDFDIDLSSKVPVSKVQIMQSDLTSEGPIYHSLCDIAL